MLYGYAGSKLIVDLTTKSCRKEPLEFELARDFIGGAGFAIKILYDNLKPRIDPLSPENIIVLSTGPAQGTLVPGSGRGIFVFKSPLTGSSFRSTFGGFLAHELKYAGYDLITITGSSDKPVYLLVDDDNVELKDATHLWGKMTYETQKLIKEELGDEKFQVACIGPAGENRVRIASVIHNIRVSGRGGGGAVLGSKKLKAIAVRGSRKVQVADVSGLIEFHKKIMEESKVATAKYIKYGTTYVLGFVNSVGGLGTRNWQTEVFEGSEKITGETTLPKYKVKDVGCAACTIGCTKLQQINEGKYAGTLSKGPEYETLYSLGSLVGVDDFEAIAASSRLCDDLGLDTISTGVTIAFAMECFEKGILTRKDTNGLELRFGNGDAVIECVKNIAYRKGLGNVLAEGVKRASETIGRGSQRFAIHVKGLGLAGHSPRALKGKGLEYAVANRGGSHHDGRAHAWDYGRPVKERAFMTEDKPQIVFATQNRSAIEDSLITCRLYEGIYGLSLTDFHCKIIKLVTGVDMTLPQLTKIAERIYTLERCFAVREGYTRKNDVLPQRMMREPIPEGPSKGAYMKPSELKKMLDEFYALRGWDVKTGIPTKDKLKELGIEYAALVDKPKGQAKIKEV